MIPPSPPRGATRLLERVADESTTAFIGDLHEVYALRFRARGKRHADRWYWLQILRVVAFLIGTRMLRTARLDVAALGRTTYRVVTTLRKDPIYSGTFVLTLAICLGANAAVFGLIQSILLEPLPFHEPDRLVRLYNHYGNAAPSFFSNSGPDFFHRRASVAAFEEVAAFRPSGHTVGEPGEATRTRAMRVTPSFFPLLGIRAAAGRTFHEDAMEPSRHRQVILSHAAWQEYFGGAGDALGRDLRIDEEPHTVVGILAEDFAMPLQPDARFFLPLAFSEEERAITAWHTNRYQLIARLAESATIEQAAEQNSALNAHLLELWPRPDGRRVMSDAGYRTLILPAAGDLVGSVRPSLYLLWAGVAVLLLIGCVNIGSLTLARSHVRRGEHATRMALGASRAQVRRHVLAECLTLGLLGSLLGVAAGTLGLRVVRGLGGMELPRGAEVSIDVPVVALTLAIGLGASAILGSIPFRATPRGGLGLVLRARQRTSTGEGRNPWARRALLSGQVGFAFVLLFGAALLFLSVRAALAVDPGFEAEDVVTAYVSLPDARYADDDARRRFWDELLENVRAIPGVERASLSGQLPFTGDGGFNPLHPLGYEIPAGESLLSPRQTEVGPDYFEIMGIPLLDGRTFAHSDGPDTPRAIIIDEWLADRFWPEGRAVGAHVVWDVLPSAASIPDENMFTVIGVVGRTTQNDLTTPAGIHRGAYYFTYRQRSVAFAMLAVSGATDDPSALVGDVRAVLADLDPNLPLFNVATMGDRVAASLVGRRLPAMLLGFFALVALALAAVGIYGALAYAVSQRTREIGVRVALGAAPREVFGAILVDGLTVTLVGLVLGVASAMPLARLMESLLFGVAPTDFRAIVCAAALLTAVATVACVMPCRRATRVDPMKVLGG